MKNTRYIRTLFLCGLLFFGTPSVFSQDTNQQVTISDKIQPLSNENIFGDTAYYNWCNSVIKGDDGKYHLFYARWKKSNSFEAWLTHSTVAHAIADQPEGPYHYVNTVLDFEKDTYKKGSMITAHNPKIKYFNGKYYLYFISTQLNHEISNEELIKVGKIASHRSNPDRRCLRESQRTYVAVSNSINGPWKVNPTSLLEPTGPIRTLVVNPAITQGPDKRFYLIVKGDKPGTTKFLRNQAIAISDYPDHGFVIQPEPVIEDWDTEDVSIWYDHKTLRFYAVFHAHKYVGMMTSKNGIHWEKATDFVLSKKCLKRTEGKEPIRPNRMERPFVYVEDGEPKVLCMACMVYDKKSEKEDTFIVFAKLKK